jgi:hypothetical protein
MLTIVSWNKVYSLLVIKMTSSKLIKLLESSLRDSYSSKAAIGFARNNLRISIRNTTTSVSMRLLISKTTRMTANSWCLAAHLSRSSMLISILWILNQLSSNHTYVCSSQLNMLKR